MKNNQVLVVIATFNGDLTLAENLINWISELDGKLPFPALIVVDQTVPQEKYAALFTLAKTVFSHVRLITIQVAAHGWKPNVMFLQAAKYVRDNYTLPFFWLEPDCVPLKSGWLANINEAYQNSPLRYLGAIVETTGQKGIPPKHLTGCSVYPNDAYDDFEAMPDVNAGRQAWDIGGGERIATASQHTPLIQHFWGQQDKPPVFIETRAADAPENHVMLDFVRKDAVLFHRSKEGNLIALLRKNKPTGVPPDGKPSSNNEKPEEIPAPKVETIGE